MWAESAAELEISAFSIEIEKRSSNQILRELRNGTIFIDSCTINCGQKTQNVYSNYHLQTQI